jgi:hypothetical protein
LNEEGRQALSEESWNLNEQETQVLSRQHNWYDWSKELTKEMWV